jgi:hypothetical protein
MLETLPPRVFRRQAIVETKATNSPEIVKTFAPIVARYRKRRSKQAINRTFAAGA